MKYYCNWLCRFNSDIDGVFCVPMSMRVFVKWDYIFYPPYKTATSAVGLALPGTDRKAVHFYVCELN